MYLDCCLITGAVLQTFSPFDVVIYNFHCMALVIVFWFAAISGFGRTYETDEQLAAEGIYIDPELSVPIPAGAKISKYKYR